MSVRVQYNGSWLLGCDTRRSLLTFKRVLPNTLVGKNSSCVFKMQFADKSKQKEYEISNGSAPHIQIIGVPVPC